MRALEIEEQEIYIQNAWCKCKFMLTQALNKSRVHAKYDAWCNWEAYKIMQIREACKYASDASWKACKYASIGSKNEHTHDSDMH